MSVRNVAAGAAAAVVLTGTVAASVANLTLMQTERLPVPVVVLGALAVGSMVGVALLLIVRTEASAIGWLLMLAGLAFSCMWIVGQIPLFAIVERGDRGFWPLLGAALPTWIPFYGALTTVAMIFPDGRLPSRGWRPVLLVSVAAYAVLFAAITVDAYPFVGEIAGLRGPFAGLVPSWLDNAAVAVAWPLNLAALIAGAAAIVVRYRRSSGVTRLQLKWLAWSTAIIPVTLAFCGALGPLGLLQLVTGWTIRESSFWILFGGLLAVCAIAPPAAIAIAITRHGLYEIDRVINRTLVYGTLTVLLGGGWAAAVLLLGVVLGRGSPPATAAATLGAVLVFRPLRDRVQSAVDRRFSRARYEGLRRIRAFEDGVREGRLEPEGIASVLAEALGDPYAELVFRVGEAGYATAEGRAVDGRPAPEQVRSAVERQGQEVGVLLHAGSLLERRDLLRSVLGAAGLAIEIARLRVQVKVHLAEVEASRARIVEAGYEERRRLERDLHDGAQQRLVSLGIALRRMQRSLPAEGRVLAPALDQAVGEVGRAIADLRALAAGVRPARLDEGLAAALADLAGTAPVPVRLDVTEERLPAPVEAAAYFVASEAVTNAIKHASPSEVRVRARRVDRGLRLSVVDDGVGGARVGAGSGLVGLADRVGAHGGSLRIESPRGRGTLIEVELPCGS